MTTSLETISPLQPERRFTVTHKPADDGDGGWHRNIVTVLDRGVPCGEYRRNYGMVESTFEPFAINDEWFALYSSDYTATRIMRLPSCEDIGGEEPDDVGFCPVQLFVPAYRLHEFDFMTEWSRGVKSEPHVQHQAHALWPGATMLSQIVDRIAAEASGVAAVDKSFNHVLSDWRHCPFGFVAGCIWGDDSSWKIEFLDLSRAAEGILVRKESFGYCELPNSMNLRDAIDMNSWTPGGANDWIGVTSTTRHNLLTGEKG